MISSYLERLSFSAALRSSSVGISSSCMVWRKTRSSSVLKRTKDVIAIPTDAISKATNTGVKILPNQEGITRVAECGIFLSPVVVRSPAPSFPFSFLCTFKSTEFVIES